MLHFAETSWEHGRGVLLVKALDLYCRTNVYTTTDCDFKKGKPRPFESNDPNERAKELKAYYIALKEGMRDATTRFAAMISWWSRFHTNLCLLLRRRTFANGMPFPHDELCLRCLDKGRQWVTTSGYFRAFARFITQDHKIRSPLNFELHKTLE